jgi:hypothetical protein
MLLKKILLKNAIYLKESKFIKEKIRKKKILIRMDDMSFTSIF